MGRNKMKQEYYSYITYLSVPLKVLYGLEDARGNRFPFYYCDREELIDFLINNEYEVQKFLDIIGSVQCMNIEDEDSSVGLYLSDVERGFKEYFRYKGKSLFSDSF